MASDPPRAAASPARRKASATGSDDTGPGVASQFETAADMDLTPHLPVRWIGWRLRLLVFAALAGCVGIFGLMRIMAGTPTIDAVWRAGVQGEVVLAASDEPVLQPHIGHSLSAVIARHSAPVAVDGSALLRAPRWTVNDATRGHLVATHRALSSAFAQGPVLLHFDAGDPVEIEPHARGFTGLGLLFWPLAALALLLYLTGCVAWLVRPQRRNALFALITLCQSGNLLFIAFETMPGLALPATLVTLDLLLRMGLDIVTAAAILHSATIHPRVVPAGGWIAAAGWLVGATMLLLSQFGAVAAHWWWPAQGSIIALGCMAIAVLTWSYRIEPNPFATIARRFGVVAVGSLSLLTLSVAAASNVPGLQHRVAEIGSVVWCVFFASLLLLIPFLSRSRWLLREFSLLAGVSTIATSLDLLFVALFTFGEFTSLTLAVFLSLGIYAGARQWILDQLTGSSALTLERSFEELYRVAREVETYPERHDTLRLHLLRDLFEPLDVLQVERRVMHARVVGDGSALLVPGPRNPRQETHEDNAGQAWVLRFARRGKRIFTDADARLADRVAEQLRRAVAYDKAVERGRSEERLRIAQDLHDDIGARLLTLMYKAQSPEVEDYVRHTLRDLKTLTRGLAATEHRLSHAAAEWKADVAQRLTEAQVDLGWSFSFDRDITLSVVQWSALTRILRELVTNAIYHAHATRVEIVAVLEDGRFSLSVADDGSGQDPQAWAHGLGLGGVRKRVKLLGGQVQWRGLQPRGICCEVHIDDLAEPPAARPA